MKYLAYDGKVFDNQDQCEAYEHDLKQKDGEQEKDYHDLMVLRDAYKAAQKKYEEALETYCEKYEDISVCPVDDLLRRLFPMI